MGQSKPLRATALIVEDDPMQREMICLLLEESDYDVIQCESAEAAQFVLGKKRGLTVVDDNGRQTRRPDGRRRARAHRQGACSRSRGDRHLGQAAPAGAPGRRQVVVEAMGASRRDPRS